MSKFKNCINCGAPIEVKTNKCPYCGTSYLDICGLKIDGKTPFVLKYGAEYNGHPVIISALAVAEKSHSITTEFDTTPIYGKKDYILGEFTSSVNTDIELHFKIIPDNKGHLFTMYVEE